MPEFTSLVFIDTETTGLYPACGHRPWEFAGIKWFWPTRYNNRVRGIPNGAKREILLMQVAPQPQWVWDQRAREVSGYDHPGRRDDRLTYTSEGAAHSLADWLHDATLVGNNVGFDCAMLEALLIDHGIVPTWKYRKYEITSIIAGAQHTTERTFPSVPIDRSRYMAPEPSNDRHTALGDAIWVERTFVDWLDSLDLPNPILD